MSKQKNNTRIEFENILFLIEEARNRAFSKVNAELVTRSIKRGCCQQ